MVDKLIWRYINENLYPTMEDISFISKKYDAIRNIIGENTFQSWSYARGTSLKPVNDLDIIYIDNSITNWDPEYLLTALQWKLISSQSALWVHHIKKQKSSIWLYFDEDEDKFSIDIVPAIETRKIDIISKEPILMVPEIQKMGKNWRKTKYQNYWEREWILSAPKWYKAYAELADKNSWELFKPFVKFIKYWKRWAKNRYDWMCLKSFHIEQICIKILSDNSSVNSLYELIYIFFNLIMWVVNWKKQFIDIAYSWELEKRYIDEYIENPEKNTAEFRKRIENEVKRVKGLLLTLKNINDYDHAMLLLKEISEWSKRVEKSVNLDSYRWPRCPR